MRSGKNFLSDHQIAVLVLIPSIITLGIFVYGFISWTAYTSLTDAKLGQSGEYIGDKNYEDLFTSLRNRRFRIDLVNTVFFTTLFIVSCLGVGLLLAILLDQKVVGENVFRTIYLFPMALSFIVTGVIWRWLFNPSQGINTLPTLVGQEAFDFQWFISKETWLEFNWLDLEGYISVAIVVVDILLVYMLWRWYRRNEQTSGFVIALLLFLNTWLLLDGPDKAISLSRPETHGFNLALIAVVIAASWQMSGYTMAMYLAGLRGIPEDLREAARVDGASELEVYHHIVLPMLRPITFSAMIVLGHISLKIFDLVYGMGGGDNLQIDIPGVNMYMTAFRGTQLGVGAAIAIILLIMVAAVIIPYLRMSLKAENEL